MNFRRLVIVVLAILLTACGDNSSTTQTEFPRLQQPADPKPPLAQPRPFQTTHHGYSVSDPYNWLKDPGYPEIDEPSIIRYLEQENHYFKSFIGSHQTLVDKLFEEFKGREDEVDSAVPWRMGDYTYRWYYQEGHEYRLWARTNIKSGVEELILDENQLAAGKKYHNLYALSISPNGRYMAFAVDDSGSERYVIQIKDLNTGELLSDRMTECSGELVWAADSKTFFYVLVSQEWRPYMVKRHTLGEDVQNDPIVYEEQDSGFFVDVKLSQSKKFIFINTGNQVQNESWLIPAKDPTGQARLMASRHLDVEFYPDHADEHFYIRTNDRHTNFRLAFTKESHPAYEHWQTLVPASDDYYFTDFLPLASHIVLEGKRLGIDEIALRDYDGSIQPVPFPESVFEATIGNNPEFEPNHIRINYQSMVTPSSVFDYNILSLARVIRKEKKIPSGYDKSHYHTERLLAPARDGVNIPVSIVYHKDFEKDGSRPMHLYAYGSYGSGMPPFFSAPNLSLLDRGFSFAIAHVRGGDELGYQWYLDGKLDKRQNTFNDFIDVAKYLINENYVSAGNISISGRSAGGELMGAATIQAPELWRSVSLIVPFVDVLHTMLDASLPLTPTEWPEWGNPISSKSDFELIRSYSPYDNIEEREYPPMLVTGGLHDPRVTYWEPAKWTAKMRAYKTDKNLLLLRTHMGAGHFSSSGRYARLLDRAEEYAFLLLAHGITE